MQYLVITPRNLEDVILNELQERNIKKEKQEYRKILITFNDNPQELLTLRSPDDILIFLKNIKDVQHQIGKLRNIADELEKIDLSEAVDVCRKIRTISQKVTFAITVSIIGERKFTQERLKKLAAKIIARKGYSFKKEGKPDIDVHLLIENDNVLFGIRLGKEPLYKRDYKRHSLPASLKANIAYALVKLARVTKNDIVLDPMCGVGTIAIEAAFIGAKAYGYDINPKAIQLAKKNMRRSKKEIVFEQRDATHTGLEKNSINKIVTNLPFEKQAHTQSNKNFLELFFKEMLRILKAEGTIVLLTNHVEQIRNLIKKTKLQIIHEREISLFGLSPHILVIKKA